MVRNRDRWEVTAIHATGSLVLAGRSGRITLPADYAGSHLELAYAQTAHGAQGRTVDRALLLLDAPSDARGVYVPMTRGRLSNEAFVVLEGERTPIDVMADATALDWVDRPAVARRAELNFAKPGPARRYDALRPLDALALRDLLDADHALGHAMERRRWAAENGRRQLDEASRRRGQLAKRMGDTEVRRDHADERVAELDRPLRRLRHRDEIDRWARVAGEAWRSIDSDAAELDDLTRSIPKLRRDLVDAEDAQRSPALDRERFGVRSRLAADRSIRSRTFDLDPPEYLTDHLGPRPHDQHGAARWDDVAAQVEQHRSAFGISDTQALLGSGAGWRDSAYATSCRITEAACKELGRDLGREVALEPPGREMGLSL